MINVKKEIQKIIDSNKNDKKQFAQRILKLAYSDQIIKDIIILFADESWKLRKTSADILINIGEKALVFLEDVYLEENEDKIYWSLYVLGNIKVERSFNILKNILENGSKNAKIHAIKNILKHDRVSVQNVLISLLNDEKWSIRKTAADALCDFGKPIINSLLAAFSKGTNDQKYWLIRCIGKIMGKEGAKALTEFYLKGKEQDRYYAILALGEINDEAVIPTIINALSDNSWLIRKQAAETLILYGDKAIPHLTEVISKTKSSDIHYWSFQIIAKILGEKFLSFLKELLLKENNINIRTYITIALGQIDCDGSIKLLINCFSDNCWLIRKQAHEILITKGSKALTQLILKLDESFENEDENICHWTLKTILKMENFALAPLKKLARSENPKIRLLIIQLLQEFRNIRTIELLLISLDDKSWPVRNTAAKAIIEFGEVIFPHIELFFKKNREIITSNQCFWIKKIFTSIKRDDLYIKLCEVLGVSDLKELTDDDETDEYQVKDNIEHISIEENEDPINDSFESNEPEVSLSEAKVSGDMIKIINNIIKDAKNEFSDMRLIAIKNIFQLNENLNNELLKKLYDTIIELLADSDKFVRNEAQKAYSYLDKKYNIRENFEIFNENDISKLLKDLLEDDENKIIKTIIKLQSFKNENVERAIAKLLRNTSNKDIQRICIETLGNFKSEKYDFVLIPFINEDKKEIVEEAINSLSKIKTEKSICSIISSYTKNRDIIVKILPKIEEKAIVKCCKTLLEDEDIGVKVGVLKLLTEIKFKDASLLFVDVLKNKNLTLNKMSLYGIQVYNDSSIIKDIKDILDDLDDNIKNDLKNILTILVNNKEIPAQIPDFKDFCNEVKKKGDFKLKYIKLEELKENSTINNIMQKAKKLTSSINKSKDNNNEIQNIELQLKETEFLIGKHIYDIFKKRKLNNMKLSKIVYDIDKLNESIEKRTKKIESGNINTSSGTEKFLGINIGKIKESLSKKNAIAELQKEIETIEIRKNKIFVNLFKIGLKIYNESEYNSEELDNILKSYEFFKQKLEKLKNEAEIIS